MSRTHTAGEWFVHVRRKHSSNKDLRMLNKLKKGPKLHKVNLNGSQAESVITNSSHLAEMIGKANCDSGEAVAKELEKEVKGKNWEADRRGFEQHMREEEEIRVSWNTGGFEKEAMA